MFRNLIVCLSILLLSAVVASAAKDIKKANKSKNEAKALSGMAIVGNDEAPKSLYIVPWKSSELSRETSLDMMSSDVDVPVDRDVFKRRLEFYKVSIKQ